MRGRGQVADDPDLAVALGVQRRRRGRYTHNPDAARARLDAAGLPGSVRARDPGDGAAGCGFKCVFWNKDSQFERIALLLQRQLAERRRRSGARSAADQKTLIDARRQRRRSTPTSFS